MSEARTNPDITRRKLVPGFKHQMKEVFRVPPGHTEEGYIKTH